MPVETISSAPALAGGNWIWLLALQRQEAALVVSPDRNDFDRLMAPHFDAVTWCGPDEAEKLPVENASIDLVAISRLQECSRGELPWLEGSIAASRNALRDGGCLLITFVNPYWARRYFSRRGSRRMLKRSQVLRALASAGFGRLASYYVQPFPEGPSSIIPSWRRAAVYHERMEHMSSAIGRFRPLVARVGGHALLYPGCACVGYL